MNIEGHTRWHTICVHNDVILYRKHDDIILIQHTHHSYVALKHFTSKITSSQGIKKKQII